MGTSSFTDLFGPIADVARKRLAEDETVDATLRFIRREGVSTIGAIWIIMQILGVKLLDARMIVETSQTFNPSGYQVHTQDRRELLARLGLKGES
jgi:hypothetical protein